MSNDNVCHAARCQHIHIGRIASYSERSLYTMEKEPLIVRQILPDLFGILCDDHLTFDFALDIVYLRDQV